MKYLKYFEKKGDNKRQGLYVGDDEILPIINYLKEKNVIFTLLYGNNYDDDPNDKYFLILITYYGKLPYEELDSGFKDYYIEDKDDVVYLSWFDLEDVYAEGNWDFVPYNNIENIKMLINTKKYNL